MLTEKEIEVILSTLNSDEIVEIKTSEMTATEREINLNKLLKTINHFKGNSKDATFLFKNETITKEDLNNYFEKLRLHSFTTIDFGSLARIVMGRIFGMSRNRLFLMQCLLDCNYDNLFVLLEKNPSIKDDVDGEDLKRLYFNYRGNCNWSKEEYQALSHFDSKLASIVPYLKNVDPKRLIELNKEYNQITVREMISVGLKHEDVRNAKPEFYEALTKGELVELINENLDEQFIYPFIVFEKRTLAKYLTRRKI